MKIAKRSVTNTSTGATRYETLIQTELGTYFILSEDPSTGDISSRRVSEIEANEFARDT